MEHAHLHSGINKRTKWAVKTDLWVTPQPKQETCRKTTIFLNTVNTNTGVEVSNFTVRCSGRRVGGKLRNKGNRYKFSSSFCTCHLPDYFWEIKDQSRMYPRQKKSIQGRNEANRRKAKQPVRSRADLFRVCRTKVIKKKIAQLKTKACCFPRLNYLVNTRGRNRKGDQHLTWSHFGKVCIRMKNIAY